MMTRQTALAILCSIFLSLPGSAQANPSEISEKLEKLTQSLVSGYQKTAAGGRESIAVFRFNTNERLAKERTGFALAELLTHHLMTAPAFTVVERNELERVLSEQRLQTTAAIDPDSAVKVGKLLGARLLVLGSAEKVGGKYSVNARIVETETGRVLSTGYEELPAKLFEEEAKPYLTLVPERQAIGLYLLYNYRRNSNRLPSQQHQQSVGCVTPGPCPVAIAPQAFSMGLIGGGIRYSPTPRWLIDASVSALAGGARFASTSNAAAFSGELQSGNVILARATVNRILPIHGDIRGMVGAGLGSYQISSNNLEFKAPVVPSIRGGVEYKPQARLGLGFFVNYDFLNAKGIDRTLPGSGVLEMNRLSLEPTVAVYF